MAVYDARYFLLLLLSLLVLDATCEPLDGVEREIGTPTSAPVLLSKYSGSPLENLPASPARLAPRSLFHYRGEQQQEVSYFSSISQQRPVREEHLQSSLIEQMFTPSFQQVYAGASSVSLIPPVPAAGASLSPTAFPAQSHAPPSAPTPTHFPVLSPAQGIDKPSFQQASHTLQNRSPVGYSIPHEQTHHPPTLQQLFPTFLISSRLVEPQLLQQSQPPTSQLHTFVESPSPLSLRPNAEFLQQVVGSRISPAQSPLNTKERPGVGKDRKCRDAPGCIAREGETKKKSPTNSDKRKVIRKEKQEFLLRQKEEEETRILISEEEDEKGLQTTSNTHTSPGGDLQPRTLIKGNKQNTSVNTHVLRIESTEQTRTNDEKPRKIRTRIQDGVEFSKGERLNETLQHLSENDEGNIRLNRKMSGGEGEKITGGIIKAQVVTGGGDGDTGGATEGQVATGGDREGGRGRGINTANNSGTSFPYSLLPPLRSGSSTQRSVTTNEETQSTSRPIVITTDAAAVRDNRNEETGRMTADIRPTLRPYQQNTEQQLKETNSAPQPVLQQPSHPPEQPDAKPETERHPLNSPYSHPGTPSDLSSIHPQNIKQTQTSLQWQLPAQPKSRQQNIRDSNTTLGSNRGQRQLSRSSTVVTPAKHKGEEVLFSHRRSFNDGKTRLEPTSSDDKTESERLFTDGNAGTVVTAETTVGKETEPDHEFKKTDVNAGVSKNVLSPVQVIPDQDAKGKALKILVRGNADLKATTETSSIDVKDSASSASVVPVEISEENSLYGRHSGAKRLTLKITLLKHDVVDTDKEDADKAKKGRMRRTSRDLGLTHYSRPGTVEAAPQFRQTPIQQTVSPGSPVSLKCSAIGTPHPVITWTHDQRSLHNSLGSSVGSIRTALGEIVSHVNLSDVTARDGGLYTCTAHNALGSISHSARINVYGPPFVRAMPNVTSVAGEDVRLWCPAGGYPRPTISWRRNSQVLPNSLRQEALTNGTLLLKNVGHEDAGRYSCVVSGMQSQTAVSHTYLHVLKPPVIDAILFNQDLQEGDRTQLTCMVKSGDLPITINWLKDGLLLQHDPDIDIKQISEFSTVLLFKELREHHSGLYTCEAANAAATVNRTAAVKVKVSPRWVVEPSSGTALVGSTVVLDCSARGFPQPVITWMRGQGDSTQDFQPVAVDGLKTSRARNGSLVLLSVTASDAGWFLCQAENSVGNPISKVIQLTVHAAARVVTEGGRVKGHVGKIISVTCEASGDDPLDLVWQRHHTPVTPGIRTSLRPSNVGGLHQVVLEIRSVTSADAGQYTCRATNPHGHHEQIFNIIVIEPPTAPAGVTVDDISSRSARVSWTLPQPAAVTIQFRTSKESWAKHGRNVSVGQWASSHVLSGLTPYQTYAVRLMADNDLGVSQPSTTMMFTTLEEAPSGAPRDVRVATAGPRSLVVTWRAPDFHLTHGPLRGYMLALRPQNLQGDFTLITRPATASPERPDVVERYEVRGLAPASLYEVAVQAFTRAGLGPLSSPRIVAATSHQAPSCGPAGVSCRSSGRGSVRVWWSPPRPQCAPAPLTGYTIVATPTKHIYQASEMRVWELNTTNLEKNLAALPPASNISVRVKAFDDVGVSPPSEAIFCLTEDDVPGPPEKVRIVVTSASTILVTWSPPFPSTGTVLHYTLYSAKGHQGAVRDVVEAGGSEATWRELTGISSGSRIQVWVTATTSAGEGSPSSHITASLSPMTVYPPVAVGGRQLWRVGVGTGVTLGCRGLGAPTPAISWTRGGSLITSDQFTQLLPGGDLHLTDVKETANYTCWVKNSEGTDSVSHYVIAITTPMPPALALSRATHNSLNLTVVAGRDGGAPMLGYTLHHRGGVGEWLELGLDSGVKNVIVDGLPCGAPRHLYLTAWNSQGSSSPSQMLIASTLGQSPGRPDPERIVEVNATCVILRLYAWPETGCPITHWKVELGSKDPVASWQPLRNHVSRETADLALCDLTAENRHLLRITAVSTAGDTSVVYRVSGKYQSSDSMSGQLVEEVLVSGARDGSTWLDAHIVAGVVSAVLLAAAIVICVCVAVRRKRYGGYSRKGENLDKKSGGEEDNAHNSEISHSHLYSPSPTKKPRGSLSSKAPDQTSDPYEICPYASYSMGSSEDTLEYGLSLHAMPPRDCLDLPASHGDRHSREDPVYGHAGRQRSHTQYKEAEYITNRSRGEYASRPKSVPGCQPPATTITAAGSRNCEDEEWAVDCKKETRSQPHCSRGRVAGAAQRELSTENNDVSSPMKHQRQHCPQLQLQHQRQHQHPLQQQQYQWQLPQQQQQQQQQQQSTDSVRGGPHMLPPVRLAR